VQADRLVVHEEVAAASGSALCKVHQRAGAVGDVNRRDPRSRGPELKHAAARHDRLDHALAKPRAVAVHPSWQCGDDRQSGDDVSVETIEGGREAAVPGGGPRRFVFGNRTRARRAVANGVADVHDSAGVTVGDRVEKMRIHREARALEYLSAVVPSGSVPRLLFEDRRHHLIGMSAVPRPHRNWKELLLEGQLFLDHVGQFATLLGTIHSRSSTDAGLARGEFADRSFFETLRLEPYYRYSAQEIMAARPFFRRLTEETLTTRLALVHGDYSPKNILIYRDSLVLLDHEVVHFGDPAFDVGFSLTHLLSKALHLIGRRHDFLQAARIYVRRYLDCVEAMEWRGALEPRAVRHTLGCMLARVVGRSPLEYLSPAERQTQLRLVLQWISRPQPRLSDLIDAFSEELDCR